MGAGHRASGRDENGKDRPAMMKTDSHSAATLAPGPTLEQIASLETLFDYLDHLTRRASVEELDAILRSVDVTFEDVAAFARFDEDRYRRNLLREGHWYHVLVLCWRSGQRSPIHDHARSTCGLRVLRGSLTETVFEPAPCGQIKAVRSQTLHAPEYVVTADADIHQVSNLEPAGHDLVTLHIYSPPLYEMGTYSLTSPRVERVRDAVHEFTDGGGI